MKNINFILTREVAEEVCKHFNKNIEELDDWEVCELVDELIDKALYN